VDLASLRLFTQVAEFGSLTRAAAMLDAAQPVLSRRLAALERQCGGPLFHRTGRGLAPTELGLRLLPRVQALLASAEDIAAEARQPAAALFGRVNVGVTPSTALPLVPLLFTRCRERLPQVTLNVLEGLGGQVDEWLSSGRVDVATMFSHRRRGGYTERTLGTVDTSLIGPKGDKLTRGPTVRFAHLAGIPLVLSSPNNLRAMLEQLARRKRIALNVVMETSSIRVQHAMVATGGCYTVSSFHSAGQDSHAALLQAARIVEPTLDRSFTVGTTTHHPLTRAAREVAKLIREVVTQFLDQGSWGGRTSARP
jgi:DNA-binding transcriptional LysR family regulator